MKNSNYSDKLKNPKWQKKRLEVLNLRGFKCDLCSCETKELHVHHRFYLKGREVWEYDNDVFQVLCCDCHEKEHLKKPKQIEVVPEKYKRLINYLNQFSLEQIESFIYGICQTIMPDQMDSFNSVMSFVSLIGYEEGFKELIEKDSAEQNEIALWLQINELKHQVRYLTQMTGFKDTEL